MTKPDIKIEASKTKVIHYMTLLPTAAYFIRQADEQERGSYHTYLAGLLFYTFTFEAFLNHLGAMIYENWSQDLERSTPTAKVQILCDKLNIECRWNEGPFQSIRTLFRKFRNKVVHLKTRTLSKTEIFDNHDEPDEFLSGFIKDEWQEFACKDKAHVFIRDVERVMELLFDESEKLGYIKANERLFAPDMQFGYSSVLE